MWQMVFSILEVYKKVGRLLYEYSENSETLYLQGKTGFWMFEIDRLFYEKSCKIEENEA